jgi:hypothetical protein
MSPTPFAPVLSRDELGALALLLGFVIEEASTAGKPFRALLHENVRALLPLFPQGARLAFDAALEAPDPLSALVDELEAMRAARRSTHG